MTLKELIRQLTEKRIDPEREIKYPRMKTEICSKKLTEFTKRMGN